MNEEKSLEQVAEYKAELEPFKPQPRINENYYTVAERGDFIGLDYILKKFEHYHNRFNLGERIENYREHIFRRKPPLKCLLAGIANSRNTFILRDFLLKYRKQGLMLEGKYNEENPIRDTLVIGDYNTYPLETSTRRLRLQRELPYTRQEEAEKDKYIQIEHMRLNVTRFPFKPKSLDLMVQDFILNCLLTEEEVEMFMDESYRTLKDDGVILMGLFVGLSNRTENVDQAQLKLNRQKGVVCDYSITSFQQYLTFFDRKNFHTESYNVQDGKAQLMLCKKHEDNKYNFF